MQSLGMVCGDTNHGAETQIASQARTLDRNDDRRIIRLCEGGTTEAISPQLLPLRTEMAM